MHRRCLADASLALAVRRRRRRGERQAPRRAAPPMPRPMRLDPPAPSARSPSGRPGKPQLRVRQCDRAP
eukprot:2609933-Pyramimonas_sp.AAC.1